MSTPREDLKKGNGRTVLGGAALAAGLAFTVVLAMERLFHPLLLQRHPAQVFKECGVAAVLVFGFSLLLQGVRKPWD